MKKDQDQIYYLGGETRDAVEKSPLLERVVKRGFEVLIMTEPIDEYAVANMPKFDGKYTLTNIGKEGLVLPGDDAINEKFDVCVSCRVVFTNENELLLLLLLLLCRNWKMNSNHCLIGWKTRWTTKISTKLFCLNDSLHHHLPLFLLHSGKKKKTGNVLFFFKK